MVLVEFCIELYDDCHVEVYEQKPEIRQNIKAFDGKNNEIPDDLYFNKIIVAEPYGDIMRIFTIKQSLGEAIFSPDY